MISRTDTPDGVAGGEAFALEGVSKRYGDVQALNEVTFSVKEGEAVGYLGPNGAGKTTTLKLLSGLTRPNAGHLRLAGSDPIRERRKALSSVGVLVETPGTLPYLRGSDLLEHIARVKGIPATEVSAALSRAVGLMDVRESVDRPMGALSTGQLRRVLLAGALMGDPHVLVLDEPTMGLDPAARADLRAVLRGLRKEGRTIFLSTHLLEDVEAVCGRVLFLRGGRLQGDEGVTNGALDPSAVLPRVLRCRSAQQVDLARVQGALPPRSTLEVDVELLPDQSFRLRFRGDEPRQAELVGSLVRAGLPISRAEPEVPDLASRYLRHVGREEAT